MDPLSQAAIGAAAAQTFSRKADLFRVGVVGALAGMAPDLDVLIRSYNWNITASLPTRSFSFRSAPRCVPPPSGLFYGIKCGLHPFGSSHS